MQALKLTTDDGKSLNAIFYPCQHSVATVVIASALGVPQKFYRQYAEYLNTQGLQCLSFGYRGTGDSPYTGDLSKLQLIDWGVQDLQAALAYATRLNSQSQQTFLIAHSIGGQVLGMAKDADRLAGAIFVGSSAPYWKRWQGLRKLNMFINACVMLPLLSSFGSSFPAKHVGLASWNLPSPLIKQWAAWMRDRDYLFGTRFGFDISHYGQLSFPIRSYAMDDDTLAPEVNVKWLLKFYSRANKENLLLQKSDIGPIGHTGFFRPKFNQSLWHESAQWLLNLIKREEPTSSL